MQYPTELFPRGKLSSFEKSLMPMHDWTQNLTTQNPNKSLAIQGQTC